MDFYVECGCLMPVAMELGLEAAVLLDDIHYGVKVSTEARKHNRDGRFWMVSSYNDFQQRFPCWSHDKVKRLLGKLRTAGYIDSCCYQDDQRDRTLWYRLTEKADRFYRVAERRNMHIA